MTDEAGEEDDDVLRLTLPELKEKFMSKKLLDHITKFLVEHELEPLTLMVTTSILDGATIGRWSADLEEVKSMIEICFNLMMRAAVDANRHFHPEGEEPSDEPTSKLHH